MALFPFVQDYAVAVALPVVGGFFNIAFTSMAQALVQVLPRPAPAGAWSACSTPR